MSSKYGFDGWGTNVARVVAAIFAGSHTAQATGLAASQILNDPFPSYFPEENATTAARLFAMPLCNGVELEEATIDHLQGYMSKGKLTSAQVVICYMHRAYQTGEYIK